MIRRLVLLRHGQTAYNRTQRIQGQFDADLDDTGRAQAIAVAPHVAALAPVVLWSSDLSRARDTAAAVAAATGVAPTYDARLREFGFGDLEGITHAEYAERDPGEYARFRQGDYDAVASAERTSAVRERMLAALGDLSGLLADGECAVAVSHGAAIRVATGAMLGWPDDTFHTLRGLDNCGRVELVDQDGRWRLAAYNRVATP